MEDSTDSGLCSTLQEDEISHANTEDSLLGSRKSTETINCVPRIEDTPQCYHIDKKKAKCGKLLLVLGLLI